MENRKRAFRLKKRKLESRMESSLPHGSRKVIPNVLNEWKTLYRVLNGCSLSRYGDGEVKHMEGKRNVSQVFSSSLQRNIIRVFQNPSPKLLIGIPNVYGNRAFLESNPGYIDSMRRRFLKWINPKHEYGSSYISRGELCGYLSWVSYWSVIGELWRDRDVIVVCGNQKRANPLGMMDQARNLEYIMVPSSSAWSEYGSILSECKRHPSGSSSVYLLCVGPTASVLASDLADTGRWAVDIGHLGLFYKKLGIEYDETPQVWNHRPTDPGYIKGVTDR